MHQIYSCSDENLEVFTVISTKSRSPVRRKAKSTQCILPKKVIAVSDYRLQGTEELLWHQAGISKQKSFCYSSNQSDAKTLQTQASPVSRHNVKWLGATEPAMRDGVVAKEHGRPLQKNTEDDISPTQGTKASLPLTGGTSHSTLSLLQKIWIKHKKKSEYLGATNSAFEAD
ncbi:vexin isoform X2 [Rhineura floridana]|uniref:vexin isoform X2 n=1 Tax=Rhineura floridana TaxID=261503 RepID=UPI002AC87514|nr:vexin isoform X2 [Rhineura floridana]